jgi:hypothetical protein
MPPSGAIPVDLAHFAAIAEWVPRVGDKVFWHGWIKHWFGVVNRTLQSGQVSIIQAGLPYLLFTMTEEQMEKATKTVHASTIRASRGGEWAVAQNLGGEVTWYI